MGSPIGAKQRGAASTATDIDDDVLCRNRKIDEQLVAITLIPTTLHRIDQPAITRIDKVLVLGPLQPGLQRGHTNPVLH
ncbi:hypothetical protein D3C78_1439090 [compost metagenome]